MTNFKDFLIKLNKNLNILREREAKYAAAAPLELLNQIDDYEQAITLAEQASAQDVPLDQLQAELSGLNLGLDMVVFMAQEPPRQPFTGRNPYQGLRKFTEAEAEFFFGRTEAIQTLVAQVTELVEKPTSPADPELMAVLGASGSGKSSLVRAGLMPALRAGQVAGSEQWPIKVILPGPRPLEALAEALLDNIGRGMAAILAELAQSEKALHYLSKEATRGQPEETRFVLVIDQFEELFTLCEDESERQTFLDQLLYACQIPRNRAFIILTMRADFYAKASVYKNLAQAITKNQMLVSPLTERELREAILLPAEAVGLKLEKDLVQALVHDTVAAPGALPLLQHALDELFRRRDGNLLTMQAYQEIGGIRGAVAHRADGVMEQLTPEQQQMVRRIFLRLIQPGEGTLDTRRRATFEEVQTQTTPSNEIEAIVQILADANLLITNRNPETNQVVLDVAHEALIQEWPTLRRWVDQGRQDLRIQRHLSQAARDWAERGQDEDSLYRGARLLEVQEWGAANPGEINPLEQAFLDTSIAFWEREAAEKEAQRQHELETAQKLAEEAEARRQAEAKRAREAERSQLTALALALAVQAQQGFAGPQRSLLLARQAYLFNQRSQGHVLAQVDAALRSALRSQNLAPVLHGHHKQAVSALEFSPDARWLASGSDDGTIRLWNLNRLDTISVALNGGHTTARVLSGNSEGIQALAFSSDSRWLAVLSGGGTACLYDLQDGSRIPIGQAGSFARKPSEAAFGPNRPYRDYSTPKTNMIAFSPDGQRLAVPDAQGQIQLWDLRRGQDPTFLRSGPSAHSVVFADNDTLIAWQAISVFFWDLRQPDVAPTALHGNEYGMRAEGQDRGPVPFPTTVSTDGQYLAIAMRYRGEEGRVELWNLREPSAQRRGFSFWFPGTLRFSGDGRRLVCLENEENIWVWDVDQPGETAFVLDTGDSWGRTKVKSLAISHDGQIIAWSKADGSIGLWYFQRPDSASRVLATGQAAIRNVVWSPTDPVLAWRDSEYSFWLQPLSASASGPVFLDGTAFAGDNTAGVSEERRREIKNRASQKFFQARSQHGRDLEFWLEAETEVYRLAANPNLIFGPEDQVNLCFVTKNDQLCLVTWKWREPDLAPQVTYGPGSLMPFNVLAFGRDPDGKLLVATNEKVSSINLWDLQNPTQPIQVLQKSHPEPSEQYGRAMFSPDGRTLVVQGGRPIRRVYSLVDRWDLDQAQLAHIQLDLGGHTYCSMAFSTDSRQLALGSTYDVPSHPLARSQSREALVVVFDLSDKPTRYFPGTNGQYSQPREFRGHMGDVLAVAFHPNGQSIASASQDQTIRLWDLSPSERSPILLAEHDGDVSSLAFSPDGNLLASGGEDNTVRVSVASTGLLAEIVGERVWRNLTMDEWRKFVGEDIPYERTCDDLPLGEGAPYNKLAAPTIKE